MTSNLMLNHLVNQLSSFLLISQVRYFLLVKGRQRTTIGRYTNSSSTQTVQEFYCTTGLRSD